MSYQERLVSKNTYLAWLMGILCENNFKMGSIQYIRLKLGALDYIFAQKNIFIIPNHSYNATNFGHQKMMSVTKFRLVIKKRWVILDQLSTNCCIIFPTMSGRFIGGKSLQSMAWWGFLYPPIFSTFCIFFFFSLHFNLQGRVELVCWQIKTRTIEKSLSE